MADNKKINLMPEDLRSKEESILAKQKNVYQLDLATPGGQSPKAKPGELSGSSVHWWQRLAEAFSRGKSPQSGKQDVVMSQGHKDGKDKNFSVPKLDIEERQPINYDVEPPKPKPVGKASKPEVESKVPEIKLRQPEPIYQPQPASEVVLQMKTKPEPPIAIRPTYKPDIPRPMSPQPVPKTETVFRPAIRTALPPKPEGLANRPYFPKRDFSLSPEPVKKETPPPAPVAIERKPINIEPVKSDEPVAKDSGPQFHQPQPRIRARFLDNVGGVDLIPAAAKMRTGGKIANLIWLSLLASALVVGIFYGILYYQKDNINKQIAARNQEITDLEKEILTFTPLNNEIKLLGDDIKLVNGVLSQHVYWTNFFELLEKYTAAEVYYKGLAAGKGGALTLEAVGTDFSSVARQLKVLQQDNAKEFVVSADISSARMETEGVAFSLVIVLNPNLFYFKD